VSLLPSEASAVKLYDLEKRFDDAVTPLPPEASEVKLDELEDKFEDHSTPLPVAASVDIMTSFSQQRANFMAGIVICLVDHDGQEGIVDIDETDDKMGEVEDLNASTAVIARGRRVSVSSQIRGVGDEETERILNDADERRKRLEELIDEQVTRRCNKSGCIGPLD
jgi:hypothetical protein